MLWTSLNIRFVRALCSVLKVVSITVYSELAQFYGTYKCYSCDEGIHFTNKYNKVKLSFKHQIMQLKSQIRLKLNQEKYLSYYTGKSIIIFQAKSTTSTTSQVCKCHGLGISTVSHIQNSKNIFQHNTFQLGMWKLRSLITYIF